MRSRVQIEVMPPLRDAIGKIDYLFSVILRHQVQLIS